MFEDVVGQHNAKSQLSDLVINNRVPHGLLFTGPVRVGKYTAARTLSRILNCRDSKHANCQCTQCRKQRVGSHSDCYEVKPDDKGFISLEPIRELVRNLQYTRHEGSYKVVVIKSAHALNNFAANALLKSLEEPSSDTVFILTTNKLDRVLETIISRCQLVRFTLLSDAQLEQLIIRDGLSLDAPSISILSGSYAPDRIRDELILFKHIWAGGDVELPEKIETTQLQSELTYMCSIWAYLLRTGQYQHKEIIVTRANSDRLSSLYFVTERASMFTQRGMRPQLIIKWLTNRFKEILV